MKNLGLFLGILFASAGSLTAQVTAELTLEQEQFLPGESMSLATRITNLSGQSLKFGRDEGWLTFQVERNGLIVAKTGEVPISSDLTLATSKRAIVHSDIAPYFNMVTPGHYTVSATIRIKNWDQQITTKPVGFDIITGAKLWEREFGVPRKGSATDASPEVRRYSLQQANYLHKQLRLYFQLTDESGKLNKVLAIGPMLSFGQPDAEVDRLSHLHVLYQNGPRSFSYTVFNPDGEMVVRHTYDFTSRPRLKADDQGNFAIVGGTRRITAGDLPPPATASNNVTTPAP